MLCIPWIYSSANNKSSLHHEYTRTYVCAHTSVQGGAHSVWLQLESQCLFITITCSVSRFIAINSVGSMWSVSLISVSVGPQQDQCDQLAGVWRLSESRGNSTGECSHQTVSRWVAVSICSCVTGLRKQLFNFKEWLLACQCTTENARFHGDEFRCTEHTASLS